MPQDLNSYQVFVSRELAKTSRQFKDIIHTRELWLSTNLLFGIHSTLEWEVEMLFDGFTCIEDEHLLSRIQKDSKLYEPTIQLKLTAKGMEYLSSWSRDKIAMRNIQDKILSLKETTERLKNSKGQPKEIIVFPNKKGQQKITIAARGIMHVYIKKCEFNGQPITEGNKKDLAADYGFRSSTSGKQLKDEYDRFNNGELDSNKIHLGRLESILQALEKQYPKAFAAVQKDIVLLRKKMQQ